MLLTWCTFSKNSKAKPSPGFRDLSPHYMIYTVTQLNHLYHLFSLDVHWTLASCVTRVQRWKTVSTRSTFSPSTLAQPSGSNSSQRRRESKEVYQRRVRGAPRTRLWSGTWPAGQETLQYLHVKTETKILDEPFFYVVSEYRCTVVYQQQLINLVITVKSSSDSQMILLSVISGGIIRNNSCHSATVTAVRKERHEWEVKLNI